MLIREIEVRTDLLNALLNVPKGDLKTAGLVHEQVLRSDPEFYGHLAAWYSEKGVVRDHQVLFLAHLLASDLEVHRDAGFTLLNEAAPFLVEQVVRFLKEEKGKVPRSTRTAVKTYLKSKESNPGLFDALVLRARKAVKSLYAGLHIKPGARAQAILFENKPPNDSRIHALKKLAKATTGMEQARIIVTYRIPYPIAVGAVRSPTPPVLAALISQMTPHETLNHLKSLKARGAFENEEIKALITTKLEAAATDKRVTAYKTMVAAKAANVDADTQRTLAKVRDRGVEDQGSISKPTAILVDKSTSMTDALDVGCRLAAMISGRTTADLHVWAFDDTARPVRAEGHDITSWEKAFAPLRASGCTSIGAAVHALTLRRIAVEQIIIVSDECENSPPYLGHALESYRKTMNLAPNLIVVRVGHFIDYVRSSLSSRGWTVDTYQFTGDYAALPNLIPLISGGSRQDLLFEILDTPLPVRTDKQLHLSAQHQVGEI